jgi:hypothetical protein
LVSSVIGVSCALALPVVTNEAAANAADLAICMLLSLVL